MASLRLPDPMLFRPGPLPSGSGWSFELKWDGFRAIVSRAGPEITKGPRAALPFRVRRPESGYSFPR